MVEKYQTLKILLFKIILFFSWLSADIGHLNYIYEGQAFDNPVRVIIKTPGVVPGLADIIVKSFDQEIDQILVTPIVWKESNNWNPSGQGPQVAPPPDIMIPIKGEQNTYQAELWLMDFGAYNIQVEFFDNGKSEIINIPVNSIANQIIPMTQTTSIILFLLMLLLIAGLSNIITIGYRESTLNSISDLDNLRIKKSYVVQFFSLILICFVLYFGNNWWAVTEQAFMKNLFQPIENQVNLVKNNQQTILQIKITDEAWIDGRIADFIPDHGKIMHLYLVNENYQQLCHLHPKRNSNDNSLFEVAIPPIEYGKYYIFIDVTLESGSNQTLKNIIEYYPENILNQNKQYFLEIDGDDSFIKENPSYYFKWINSSENYYTSNEINLNFQMLDMNNNPVILEPYIQMGGHGAIIDSTGNVFIHIHPIGTISMASQELYDKEYDLQKSGICYFGLPDTTIKNYTKDSFINSFLSFPPIIIDKTGKYFMWIQGKSNNEIITEKFEFNIMNE